ncbi:hypothetical protein BZA05DRAFT_383552 [Tricharina praecox]|uniref:uncharacterized protein n=1 Tax=Tricharina praecox TaxID=43433 RepID=UPI00221FAFC6|nr:uncharacterized protein BZA05DRAFT_383552 [Tricharina praecox]KAI5859169.1 hypothetical protein BZA05DRAFT_383552 [Tricharina praecox]
MVMGGAVSSLLLLLLVLLLLPSEDDDEADRWMPWPFTAIPWLLPDAVTLGGIMHQGVRTCGGQRGRWAVVGGGCVRRRVA